MTEKKAPKPAQKSYLVHHAFGHKGKKFGPRNAHEVSTLPKSKIEDLLDLRYIEETDPIPAPSAAPAPDTKE